MKLYGLFFYHYDHTEWESLIDVSLSSDRLKDLVEEWEVLALSKSAHDIQGSREQPHYFIKRVNYTK